jgi:hypothetical protein
MRQQVCAEGKEVQKKQDVRYFGIGLLAQDVRFYGTEGVLCSDEGRIESLGGSTILLFLKHFPFFVLLPYKIWREDSEAGGLPWQRG